MDEELDLFRGMIAAINVGIRDFGSAMEEQDVQVIYVDWTPPAGGDEDMLALLDQLL